MLHYRVIFSHNVMLSRNVMLSCQALSRSAQVVSPRTSWVAAARRNLGTSNQTIHPISRTSPKTGNVAKVLVATKVPGQLYSSEYEQNLVPAPSLSPRYCHSTCLSAKTLRMGVYRYSARFAKLQNRKSRGIESRAGKREG